MADPEDNNGSTEDAEGSGQQPSQEDTTDDLQTFEAPPLWEAYREDLPPYKVGKAAVYIDGRKAAERLDAFELTEDALVEKWPALEMGIHTVRVCFFKLRGRGLVGTVEFSTEPAEGPPDNPPFTNWESTARRADPSIALGGCGNCARLLATNGGLSGGPSAGSVENSTVPTTSRWRSRGAWPSTERLGRREWGMA